MVGAIGFEPNDFHRVNFEVVTPKPFACLAFPLQRLPVAHPWVAVHGPNRAVSKGNYTMRLSFRVSRQLETVAYIERRIEIKLERA